MITLPLIDSISPGCDSYVLPGMMPPQSGLLRSWSFAGRLRSVQTQGMDIIKDRSGFVDHLPPDALAGLLDDAARREVERPSGYSDLFHQTYTSPRIGKTAKSFLNWEVSGGWQHQSVANGRHPGTWRKYDIRSAYLWSLTQGLPNPKGFAWVEHYGRKPALYLAELPPMGDSFPFPFSIGGLLLVTGEELEAYGISPIQVVGGIAYQPSTWDVDRMRFLIESWPYWKQIGRSYWGRWASRGELDCATYKGGKLNKQWSLKNPFFNPIWAHLIVSRVRLRLWQTVRAIPTARVYVDSVVIQGELPTGESVGDWRLEETYCGLDIRGLNWLASITAPGRNPGPRQRG